MHFTPEQIQAMKDDRLKRYSYLNQYVQKKQILFAGSSLMEQFPIYEFLINEHLPYTIYNRGVSGFKSYELYEHLDTCILDLEPAILFINVGSND